MIPDKQGGRSTTYALYKYVCRVHRAFCVFRTVYNNSVIRVILKDLLKLTKCSNGFVTATLAWTYGYDEVTTKNLRLLV